MCKSFVGIRHAVYVFPLTHRRALFAVGSDEFLRQGKVLGPTLFVPDRCQYPANRQGLLPGSINLHRYLVSGTTDSLAANFNGRLYVFNGLREHLNRFAILDLFLDFVERR